MLRLVNDLVKDESGFIISAELVLISTVLVIGLVTGLTCLRNAVNAELTDVSCALRSLDQSYCYTGFHGYKCDPCGPVLKAWTAGSSNMIDDESTHDLDGEPTRDDHSRHKAGDHHDQDHHRQHDDDDRKDDDDDDRKEHADKDHADKPEHHSRQHDDKEHGDDDHDDKEHKHGDDDHRDRDDKEHHDKKDHDDRQRDDKEKAHDHKDRHHHEHGDRLVPTPEAASAPCGTPCRTCGAVHHSPCRTCGSAHYAPCRSCGAVDHGPHDACGTCGAMAPTPCQSYNQTLTPFDSVVPMHVPATSGSLVIPPLPTDSIQIHPESAPVSEVPTPVDGTST